MSDDPTETVKISKESYAWMHLEANPIGTASELAELKAALTRANAATAAAYEVAAKVYIDGDWPWHSDADDAIRALATPDQTAAMDRLIAEAEARVWEKAAGIAGSLLIRATVIPDTPTEATYSGFVDDAILAASKKGGV